MSAGEVLERLEVAYREDAVRARGREGVELYYESTGAGPVVLTLNNFFMTTPTWRVFTDELSVGHRVVSYDLCGHGRSSHPEKYPTWDEHVEDVVGLLDALEIDQAYLLSTSISTVLARDVALKHPDRVKGIVLAGPALGPRGMRRHRLVQRAWLLTLEQHGMAALYAHLYPEVFGAEMIEELGTPGFLGLRESFLALSTKEDLVNGLKLALTGETSADVLARIEAPTLVVIGDDDVLLSPSGAKELAEKFPNGRYEIMPGAGHLPFLDDAAGFQALVAKFIDEVETRA
ncbi:alpha/beta fold hydrolase [Micromonospora sp. C51]|uniref:alpha/beta fold hydrolase n=1 Tax=Micromonospora sp. C51 TaxID=2824879 RepID=UPI001B37620E|nr:alpha/beta fold hydrolase [Micromonospora sp. C51]MBQ1047299.1 alpha/beta fold hydrolase [Micromonospora sp. C51]